MWTWRQASGQLLRDGSLVASGYSGFGPGKNNPAYEAVEGEGPIPCGLWAIGAPYDSDQVGPYALPYQTDQDAGWNEPPIGPEWAGPIAPTYFNFRKVSIYGGSNEIQKNIIAKAILGL